MHETVEKAHGRIEIRRIQTSTALNGYLRFPGVQQVFRVERMTTDVKGDVVKGRKSTTEISYGITSASNKKMSPERLGKIVREHWGVESNHHIRDRTFDEDRSQVRKGNAPHMLAILRNLAISMLRIAGVANIATALRRLDRSPAKILRLVGA